MIAKQITDLIGATPMVELNRLSADCGLTVPIVAKVEAFNPAGSAKDRVALAMICEAENAGMIAPGDTIIEPTSGNTGVGLAMVSAVKGYRLILTMPETMSIERRNLLKAYGADIRLTEGDKGMAGAIEMAEQLRDSIPGAVILQQFDNPANPMAHYQTTAEEIWQQADGCIDVFVAGVGTGGTLSGVGKRLKEYNPDVWIVAVEPMESPVLSGGKAASHKIQGIGANFVPSNYDADVVDEVVCIAGDEAMDMARRLAKREGLLVGISSGASVLAAIEVAKRKEMQGKRIVAFLPDTGERYLSVLSEE